MGDKKLESKLDPNTETEKASSPQTGPVENSSIDGEIKKQRPTSGICRRGLHLPLILSVIAILLASYSFYITRCSSFTRNIDKRVGELSSQVAVIGERLSSLDEGIESDKQVLIQAGLKKTLLNIQDIGKLAKGEAQAKIAEIEGLLLGMTTPDEDAMKEQDISSAEESAAEASATEILSQEETAPVVAEEPASSSQTSETPAEEQATSTGSDPATDSEPALKAETSAESKNPATSTSEF